MIIGLGYKARVGKDTIGDYLEDRKGWGRTSFAASLKEACKTIFGLSDEQVYGNLKEVQDTFWNTTPREILQKVGTDALRNNYRQDIWVKSLERRVLSEPNASWVITDVRFPNEAEAIKSWGGFIVRVDRPDAPGISTTGHSSEHAMDKYQHWDGIIKNTGSFTDLFENVDQVLEQLSKQKLLSEAFLRETYNSRGF
jgi:hypothetical protein